MYVLEISNHWTTSGLFVEFLTIRVHTDTQSTMIRNKVSAVSKCQPGNCDAHYLLRYQITHITVQMRPFSQVFDYIEVKIIQINKYH